MTREKTSTRVKTKTRYIAVFVTPEEHGLLRSRALAANVSMSDLARTALGLNGGIQ